MRKIQFSNLGLISKRALMKTVQKHFSPSFYLSQLPDSERQSVTDPLDHFLSYWSKNGCDPNPHFSMKSYLEANPDVAACGQNPLVHFIKRGISEHRPLVSVDQLVQIPLQASEGIGDYKRLSVLEKVERNERLQKYLLDLGVNFEIEPDRVDELFYRSLLPDQEIINCDYHYDEHGWKAGLNPTPWFNTKFYLEFYDDVKQAEINPFRHFVQQGFKEFRVPNHPNYRNFVSVLNGSSIDKESRTWLNENYCFTLADISSIKKIILRNKIKNNKLVISIGHSQYLSDVGGIQLYTYIEAQKFNKLKINYLHLSPSRVLPVLADASHKELAVKLTFNNEEIPGDFMLSEFVDFAAEINAGIPPIAVIVNSLYGWHPELLNETLNQIGSENNYWVIHDYSMFCSNSNLNFENLISCNNPKLDARICSTCRYGKSRTSHVHRITQLLESRTWKLVSPSKSATENVSKFLRLNLSTIATIPHGQLLATKKLRNFSEKPRIAYVGHPIVHKGWLNYLNLVDKCLKEFDFYHFGSTPSNENGIKYFPLRSQFTSLNSARDLLISKQIDAVFICPTWEETFSFVTYESLAAGCVVICTKNSGNVIDASHGRSIVYDPEIQEPGNYLMEKIFSARQNAAICDFEFSGTIASEFEI